MAVYLKWKHHFDVGSPSGHRRKDTLPRIRLIATDMDGTLLGHDQIISPANARALRDAHAAGIAIAICSGRMVEDISYYAEQAGISCWVCGSNGCRLLDGPYGELMEEHCIVPESALASVDAFDGRGLYVSAFAQGDILVAESNGSDWKWQEAWAKESAERGMRMRYVDERGLRDAARRGVNKFILIEHEGTGVLAQTKASLENVGGIDLTSSWSDNIEIMPAGVNKGSALSALAARLGIPREAVMAIGDHENDREMLTWAGVGVAMGNAIPAIQSAARYVTQDNAHDGVAEAIRRWAL